MWVFKTWTWLELRRNSQAEKGRRETTFEPQHSRAKAGGEKGHILLYVWYEHCVWEGGEFGGRAVVEFKPERKGEYRR